MHFNWPLLLAIITLLGGAIWITFDNFIFSRREFDNFGEWDPEQNIPNRWYTGRLIGGVIAAPGLLCVAWKALLAMWLIFLALPWFTN
jgi:hypothetical protein